MQPVITPAEMAAIDAEAPEPIDELIDRAGWATAKAAIEMLGGRRYGRRVAILAGKGNNGADGRRAAHYLERAGIRCVVHDVPGSGSPGSGSPGSRSPGSGSAGSGSPERSNRREPDLDLIIDACFGTGLARDFDPDRLDLEPSVGSALGGAPGVPILAVDIASGVDGLTGEIRGRPLCATATVTFAAVKPGLLFDPGRQYCGEVSVADIGLDCSRATAWHLDQADIVANWPKRDAATHKWRRAVYVVGGSPGMVGAPALCAAAAFRAGAGYVARSTPGERVETATGTTVGPAAANPFGPMEAVAYPAPQRWAEFVLARLDRFGAAVVGPGLAPGDATELGTYVDRCDRPTVFDAGALDGLAELAANSPGLLSRANGPLHVVTPHDGEYSRLFGRPPGVDRMAAARYGAQRLGAVLLLKGSSTVVAHPDGRVLLSTAGDQRLATAGTGDVLSGVIAAGLAGGLEPFLAAGVGAELHGRAGIGGYRVGMTAGDLPSLVASLLSELFQAS